MQTSSINYLYLICRVYPINDLFFRQNEVTRLSFPTLLYQGNSLVRSKHGFEDRLYGFLDGDKGKAQLHQIDHN